MTLSHYRLYDLVIASELELALTEIDPGEVDDPWTFEEAQIGAPTGRLIHDVIDFDGERRLKVSVDDDRGVLFSHGATRVRWDRGSRTIQYDRGEERQLGPGVMLERVVAPISMIVERTGYVALHASAVLGPDGGAWIFVGNSGAGKSTTALELSRRGLPILADDLVMIDGPDAELLVATPTVRLFDQPDEVPEAVDNCKVLPQRRKYWYRLTDDEERPTSVPLRGIVSLEPTNADDWPETAAIERVGGREATVRVIGQAFDLTEADADWRAARFRTLCDLARRIDVYRLAYRPDDRSKPVQLEALSDVFEVPERE